MRKLLMTMAMAAMLSLPASAAVRFGVSIGGPYYYGPPVYSTYCGPYGCYPAGYVYYGRYGRPYYYDGHRYHRYHRYYR
jgi:hypothetical protein